MLPSPVMQNAADGALIDAKANCRTRLADLCGAVKGANKLHLFLRKFGSVVLLSPSCSPPSFLPHVLHVVLVCAEKEMRRVAEGRGVAGVEDAQLTGAGTVT